MSHAIPRWVFALASITACSESRSPAGDGPGIDAGGIEDSGLDGGEGDSVSGGPKLDVDDDPGQGEDGGDCSSMGGGGGGDIDFSNIWIANSGEGTVSKIDTMSGAELARYVTGPGPASSMERQPSRTTVNQYGDMAVANRGSPNGGFGSVTKIAARTTDCSDRDGNGSVDTSTGPTDVREWMTDECVQWNVDIPSADYYSGPRPVAWEGGGIDDAGCQSAAPRLWVGWYDGATSTGNFRRLDGATGDTVDEVQVPGWSPGGPTGQWGPYGGAVNAEGDLWVVGLDNGPLVRIYGDTLDVEVFEIPIGPQAVRYTYGMALDAQGRPWIASMQTAVGYDPQTEQWMFVETTASHMRGINIDREGRAWIAVHLASGSGGQCGVSIVDTKSATLLENRIDLPGCIMPVGVSIDVEGFVWLPDVLANRAFKVDPDTRQVVLTVEGLNGPYTYSDMTGSGLDLVVNPPQG